MSHGWIIFLNAVEMIKENNLENEKPVYNFTVENEQRGKINYLRFYIEK